jgi:sec-independent protein translocase protein TatA
MELVIIFLVILLVFGAKRIPEIAQGLGKGIREFKDATSDIKKEMTTPVPPQQQIHQSAAPPPVYVAPTPVAEPVVTPVPPAASQPLGDVTNDPAAPRL